MLEVATGSRLHFGLMELADGEPLRFAGMGLMLAQPGWHLRFYNCSGSEPRVRISDSLGEEQDVEVETRIAGLLDAKLREATTGSTGLGVEVLRSLSMHSGLGAGTQLAAAISAGILLIRKHTSQPSLAPSAETQSAAVDGGDWVSVRGTLPELTTSQLAALSGRGLRSAIGLQGFAGGGLILDEGYSPSVEPRPIAASSVSLPAGWRVVLIQPGSLLRISGEEESHLLGKIAQSANPNRHRMIAIAKRALQYVSLTTEEKTVSSQATFFSQLMDYLEEYMRLAAELFAAQQGGLYNGSVVAAAVEVAQQVGLRGVGQSSWGPCVFGFAESQVLADQMVLRLQHMLSDRHDVLVAQPDIHGALWRFMPSAT